MLLFCFIGILIVLQGLKDFRKGFLWLLIYKIFLVQNISLIDIPGVPLLTMDVGLTLFYVFLFQIRKTSCSKTRVPFPYTKPFTFLAISWTLSAIFSQIGIGGAVSQLVKDLCHSLIMVWMMWEIIEDDSDFRFLIKWFTISFFVAALYTYYEKMIEANPLQEYYISLMGNSEKAIDFQYTNDVRGYRAQSVFEHAIGAGINFAMYIIWITSTLYAFRANVPSRLFTLVTVVLSFPCVLMANSRGSIFFLMICSLMFINVKNFKTVKLLIGVGVVLFLLMPLLGEYADIVISIFDSNKQADVGGSNSEMRFEQLAASIIVVQEHPILGLGQKFQNVMSSGAIDALLGMESMWFNIITTFGLLGVIVNVIYAYFALIKVPKKFKSRYVFFISLAYWVTGSLTSVPGILDHMYYLLIIYFIKQSEVYQHLKLKYDTKI